MMHGLPLTDDADEPAPWECVGLGHSRYKGRDFYGDHADDLAELNYLRDFKEWAAQKIKALRRLK